MPATMNDLSPLANPASMGPQATSNFMGDPLANGGGNMGPFAQKQAMMGGGQPQGLPQGQGQPPMQAPLPAGPFRLGGLQSQQQMPEQMPQSPQANSMLRDPMGMANQAMSMQMQFMPKALQTSSSAGNNAGYKRGGLAYAYGGMPGEEMAPEEGMPQEMGAEPGADMDENLDPALVEKIQNIFMSNMDNPQKLAEELLKMVHDAIKASLSPEELELTKTPEGQAVMASQIKKIMGELQGVTSSQEVDGVPQPVEMPAEMPTQVPMG